MSGIRVPSLSRRDKEEVSMFIDDEDDNKNFAMPSKYDFSRGRFMLMSEMFPQKEQCIMLDSSIQFVYMRRDRHFNGWMHQ